MALHRVTITIPWDVLAAADRRARELGRSRSWVVAEAVRAYASTRPVREAAPAYETGLGSSRQAQLDADLALTPEQRVRESEQTALEAALGRATRASPGNRRLIQFDRYEDYLRWKDGEGRLS